MAPTSLLSLPDELIAAIFAVVDDWTCPDGWEGVFEPDEGGLPALCLVCKQLYPVARAELWRVRPR